MPGNPMNIPPVSIAAAKAALIEQYADPVLRRRASMLWGSRGVGKSSIVRQVAAHFDIPLVDLRLTTIEPVDIRGAIYADDALEKTVWFPPEFLPNGDQRDGILFLDELTAADLIPARLEAASTWVRGKRVDVHGPQACTGVTEGLDAHGFLLVRTPAGLVTIQTGGIRESTQKPAPADIS